MSDFAGEWFTTFGPMTLTQSGARVQGVYHMGPQECSIEGKLNDGKLTFRYQEPTAGGEGWFAMQRHGRFAGRWRQDGSKDWHPWQGERGFEGIWQTSFGPMRLIHNPDKVEGFYDGLNGSSIEGRMDGTKFVFRYREPTAAGEGWFTLAEGGAFFEGQWRQDGAPLWAPWQGERVLPVPRLSWLVVLEAYWQRGLGEKEYAFGNMLREFFARVPHVEVRQRFFNNEAGLVKWCRELLYLAEPIALVLATHGNVDGLSAGGGEVIRPEPLAKVLRYATNIQVLHFSSCLLMDQGPAGNFGRVLEKDVPFPISGYATSVDWAASALIEFTYLDMILARGLSPSDAAEQVTKLISFAGDEGSDGSPFPPAQFRYWAPGQ